MGEFHLEKCHVSSPFNITPRAHCLMMKFRSLRNQADPRALADTWSEIKALQFYIPVSSQQLTTLQDKIKQLQL